MVSLIVVSLLYVLLNILGSKNKSRIFKDLVQYGMQCNGKQGLVLSYHCLVEKYFNPGA